MMARKADDLWTARLKGFLDDCVRSTVDDEGERMAEAASLFLAENRGQGGSQAWAAAGSIDRLLSNGAPVDAAISLMGEGVSFMLSRGGGGTCLATIVVVEGSEEVVAEGATPALALIGAYAAALLAEGGGDSRSLAPAHPSGRVH
ncbi:hypothetical protein B2G71_01415 [Novosphingobium sp. PC22D]|uniref:hypothetical protein n=1 Tax=Novosphingobium sp. PC22D TaxID=1962403 RepID=UPI000BF0FCA7|nr:hypothetical protein [Novosphingobium sp. PC22D]PEQ14290.1 hypothetical protein B2G71_01415 [Novosphingobium sp. PC22D]